MRHFHSGILPILALAVVMGAAPATSATAQQLPADTPSTTTMGATFIAPAGWCVVVKGPATIIEAPEGDSRIALVDVRAKDREAAIAEAGFNTFLLRSRDVYIDLLTD